MKIYRGHRDIHGDPIVEVIEEVVSGSQVHDVERLKCYPLRHVVRHSQGSFEWGYSGAGPSDLARCILLDLGYTEMDIDELYHAFKRQYIESADYDGFMISEQSARGWYDWKKGGEDDELL